VEGEEGEGWPVELGTASDHSPSVGVDEGRSWLPTRKVCWRVHQDPHPPSLPTGDRHLQCRVGAARHSLNIGGMPGQLAEVSVDPSDKEEGWKDGIGMDLLRCAAYSSGGSSTVGSIPLS
jgi:hypothetical protein